MIKIWGQPCTVRKRRGPGGGWLSSRSHGASRGLSWPGGSSYPSAPPAPWQPRAKSQTPGHAAGTSGGRNVRLGAPDLLQQQRRPLGLCGRRAALLPTELQLTEGSTGATVLRTVPLLTPLPGAPGLDPSRPTACWEDSLCPGAAPDLHQGVSRVESGGVTTWRMKDLAPRTAVVTPIRHAGQVQQHNSFPLQSASRIHMDGSFEILCTWLHMASSVAQALQGRQHIEGHSWSFCRCWIWSGTGHFCSCAIGEYAIISSYCRRGLDVEEERSF